MQQIRAAACMLATIAAFPALAQTETIYTGTVSRVATVGSGGHAPGNADTRVWLSGVPSLCTGASFSDFAFINVDDANYKGLLATLLTAATTGKQVVLHTLPATLSGASTGSTTYCHLDWAEVMM